MQSKEAESRRGHEQSVVTAESTDRKIVEMSAQEAAIRQKSQDLRKQANILLQQAESADKEADAILQQQCAEEEESTRLLRDGEKHRTEAAEATDEVLRMTVLCARCEKICKSTLTIMEDNLVVRRRQIGHNICRIVCSPQIFPLHHHGIRKRRECLDIWLLSGCAPVDKAKTTAM